jgi:hypothetical protein
VRCCQNVPQSVLNDGAVGRFLAADGVVFPVQAVVEGAWRLRAFATKSPTVGRDTAAGAAVVCCGSPASVAWKCAVPGRRALELAKPDPNQRPE